jgi:hypothetical protein
MHSKSFITETRNIKEKRIYGKTIVEIEYRLNATAEKNGRMILASARPTRIRINDKEVELEENTEQTA